MLFCITANYTPKALEAMGKNPKTNRREAVEKLVTAGGGKLVGDQKLECELTVKGGQVVWDLNGISRPVWTEGPAPGAKR